MWRLQKYSNFSVLCRFSTQTTRKKSTFLCSQGSHYTWPYFQDTAWVAKKQRQQKSIQSSSYQHLLHQPHCSEALYSRGVASSPMMPQSARILTAAWPQLAVSLEDCKHGRVIYSASPRRSRYSDAYRQWNGRNSAGLACLSDHRKWELATFFNKWSGLFFFLFLHYKQVFSVWLFMIGQLLMFDQSLQLS